MAKALGLQPCVLANVISLPLDMYTFMPDKLVFDASVILDLFCVALKISP